MKVRAEGGAGEDLCRHKNIFLKQSSYGLEHSHAEFLKLSAWPEKNLEHATFPFFQESVIRWPENRYKTLQS